MSEVGDAKQNWAGLICPVCRFVFRVPANHRGAGVVCPACAHLLQIPSAQQRQMVANARASRASKELIPRNDIKKHVDENSQLVKEADHIQDGMDSPYQQPAWEHSAPAAEPISPLTWILSGSLLGVSIVLVSIWLVVQSIDENKNIEIIPDQKVESPIAEVESDSLKVQEGQMIKESKKVIEEFLEAETASDLEGLVRTPDITIPRMQAWYQSDAWVPIGARVLGHGDSIKVSNQMITMDVKLDDFSVKTMSVEKTESGYKIDWESWVAWSSVRWPDLFDLRPNQPVEVRVHCKRINYYNRLFNDSNKWFAVRLSHPNSDRSIYGYIDTELPQFHRFITELVREKEVSATLKISYPTNSPVGNQVTIIEHVQSGWVREASPNNQPEKTNTH